MTAELANTSVPVAHAAILDFCGDVLQVESPGDDRAVLREALDKHFSECDAIISSAPIEVPKLFVSDMDSTMIGQECIDELADFAGLKDKVADITERAMQGELDFESALTERVGLLTGLEESAITRCLEERITSTPGARTLVQTLKSRGCKTVLVTGGFHHFADVVAKQLGFDRVVGNRLEVTNSALTGRLDGPIVDSATKKAVLLEELAALGESAVSMSAGDGANDIPMLQASSYGIAYRAKPKARAASNGWIDRGDLTSLLKLLEIPEMDWVA
ncbi:phosphoserine phosphatase SerB [Aurantiacibacter sp. D1-12]|uniref:phosphoserine phosphatase SerB n=1 Tax=Aurantiacibacter sp. D1-12 TaxID=2993658 RepID=UPI00237CB78C|nr:phosphoserine phosphatase SerB [Aurantiacibacter sp. D1-12]MDE1466828.1 phosphoserine phosphatase SerB [Aurantiacibacter sp. D1-12]